MDFIVKKISQDNMLDELNEVGFDSHYIFEGLKKHTFLNFKIYNVSAIQATIIKQTALSASCDCAVHRDVLGNLIQNSCCVLSGSYAQLLQVSRKLKNQQFHLCELSNLIERELEREKTSKTQVFGILNLSEDSFSADFKNPILRIDELILQNADIIDVGAESTRPAANSVCASVQIEKLKPVIKYLKDKGQTISVDTRSAEVADFALSLGADIINDVSFANYEQEILDVVLKYQKKYVLTHSRGVPSVMDNCTHYENVLDTVFFELSEKLEHLLNMGFERKNVIIDVGFGFAKNVEQNLILLKHIEEFKSLGCPLLAGISRKRVVQNFAKTTSNDELDFITSLTSFYFALKNVDYIRVHNVRMTRQALELASCVK